MVVHVHAARRTSARGVRRSSSGSFLEAVSDGAHAPLFSGSTLAIQRTSATSDRNSARWMRAGRLGNHALGEHPPEGQVADFAYPYDG
jgi:hypothetical protein